MPQTDKYRSTSGVCVYCGSMNLDYNQGVDIDGSDVSYPYSCFDCGESGIEWYTLTFVENAPDES